MVVHDAARPLASRTLFAAVIAAVDAGADAAIPALPIVDTVKRVDGIRVLDTVPRADLVVVQTPQAFRAAMLRAAHAGAAVDTDDAALVEAHGGTVVIVPGETRNLKLTVAARPRARAGAPRHRRRAVRHRVGLGFDVHPFGDAPPLVLGGVRIEDAPRLAGHSDGDAVAHAVADALLGPAGLPDLGTLFPAGDDTYRDADSLVLLRDVATRVAKGGWWIDNVDVVVAAEEPKLAPHVAAMVDRLVDALAPAREPMGHGIAVAVKPKRGEGLGAIGRAEGIAVWAVALARFDAAELPNGGRPTRQRRAARRLA